MHTKIESINKEIHFKMTQLDYSYFVMDRNDVSCGNFCIGSIKITGCDFVIYAESTLSFRWNIFCSFAEFSGRNSVESKSGTKNFLAAQILFFDFAKRKQVSFE